MRKYLALFLCGLIQFFPAPVPAADGGAEIVKYRGWIIDMEARERGPFSRLRWFCKDGTVQPPKAYACKDHGGGYQHGEWSRETRELRRQGYLVANVLAGLNAAEWVDDPDFHSRYAQLLIERFLMTADDGWIMRRALFYRGAIQEEDERAAARALLTEMCSRDDWIGPGYVALRTGVRMLPHGNNSASFQKVRQVSASLAEKDGEFKPIRAKIHGSPGAEDAARVREYAAALATEAVRQPYLDLADEIDAVYQAEPLETELDKQAAAYADLPWLQELLHAASRSLRNGGPGASRYITTSHLLANLRNALPRISSPATRLDILDLSLRVEVDNFSASTALRADATYASRRRLAGFLKSAGVAAYGTGVVNARLFGALDETLATMMVNEMPLDAYMRDLAYLGRTPGWGTQTLRMFFYDDMEKLAQIEPLAMLFIQDQLRGSPLMFFSNILNGLSRDANQLAGVKHRMFDEEVGVGFIALNPGLANGVLHVEPDLSEIENFAADGIYVLPETVSDLPPVAGILTAGEGNPLSHVQLLARNLGIPNVTVDAGIIEWLAQHDGERIVMAVSKSGLVEIAAWSDRWSQVFEAAEAADGVVIRPDLDKLDLSVNELVPLDDLRAIDSGRSVGPKAAKLGELRAHYPVNVSRGVAIPFGVFRQEVFEKPAPDGDGTVFDWMLRNYSVLDAMPADDPARARKTEAFRAQLYDVVVHTEFSPQFKDKLGRAMQATFGTDDPPGVFVRSDTNVEDLAGFTGAGLNLTLPNVVGFDNLLAAISQVWASPFTARAFAWRQSHMEDPQHVYTSILLLESVGSDKSGVLVTQDIDTGNRDVVSVAVNEGLGGAVDGQAAESLRIPLDGSDVQVLATATAPWKRVLNPTGGLIMKPSSGSDTVLQPAEIEQVIVFARHLPETFPAITDDEGNPAPADVEFGFLNGDLKLFQLRPFLESKMAKSIAYLQQMDARLTDTTGVVVNMNGVPGR